MNDTTPEFDIESLKQSICAIGRRIYQKNFAAANEGNLSVRISEDRVLCTPTLCCKGFMEPDDICTVDLDGNQVAGKRPATSEVRLHLVIYRERPDVTAVVHCHPPHATAFGVAREPIPQCVLPEPDIFLGEVPIAPYETPGNQNFAETIMPFVKKTNTIILANHGTVSYSTDIEQAYWLTEILDAYCRILILAKQIGGIHQMSLKQGQELLQLRGDWGFNDPRNGPEFKDKQCEICNHISFRDTWAKSGVQHAAFPPFGGEQKTAPPDNTTDSLIEKIADRVVQKLSQRNN